MQKKKQVLFLGNNTLICNWFIPGFGSLLQDSWSWVHLYFLWEGVERVSMIYL